MTNAAQQRATRNYRARLEQRGFKRFELMALETDRDMLRTLARRLAEAVASFEDVQVPTGAVDISLYRDDLVSRATTPPMHPTDIPVDVTGRDVVLVDDVLHTGRSTRAALDALTDFGRPSTIQLAVVVDRGHRELPIRADYAGKNIPTALYENVEVRLEELDGEDAVRIVANPEVANAAAS